MVCGGRVESGSLVFANKNGGRQEGEGVYMCVWGGGKHQGRIESLLLPLSYSSKFDGPWRWSCMGNVSVLEAFVVSGLRA